MKFETVSLKISPTLKGVAALN